MTNAGRIVEDYSEKSESCADRALSCDPSEQDYVRQHIRAQLQFHGATSVPADCDAFEKVSLMLDEVSCVH